MSSWLKGHSLDSSTGGREERWGWDSKYMEGLWDPSWADSGKKEARALAKLTWSVSAGIWPPPDLAISTHLSAM